MTHPVMNLALSEQRKETVSDMSCGVIFWRFSHSFPFAHSFLAASKSDNAATGPGAITFMVIPDDQTCSYEARIAWVLAAFPMYQT
jgi:hypothetical protein